MMFDRQRWNAAIEESRAWIRGGLHLARPGNGSVFHQLIDAWHRGDLIEGNPSSAPPEWDPEVHFKHLLDHPFHVFVIEHDWAGVFAHSDVDISADGTVNFRQPYTYCAFEFLISSKRVCLIANFDGQDYQFAAFVRLHPGWFQVRLGDPETTLLRHLLFTQHQATMVMLDARVAQTEVIRASFALNRAREKRGKQPLFDYHIVNLAHRSEPLMLPPDQEAIRNSPRLHFRRGHWRHFESFKTWISWMLIGDPDLGFIDKHYRL